MFLLPRQSAALRQNGTNEDTRRRETLDTGIESDQVQVKREHTHLESRGPHVASLAGLQIPGGGLQAGLAQDEAAGRGGSIRMSGF